MAGRFIASSILVSRKFSLSRLVIKLLDFLRDLRIDNKLNEFDELMEYESTSRRFFEILSGF